jgi:hypothetical protein
MTRKRLLIVAIVALFMGVYLLRKAIVHYQEIYSRPWAYSSDPGSKLLVGRWQGSFKDPAGVEKQLSLAILIPVTEEELEDKMTRAHRSRVRSRDKRSFDGNASIHSQLGQESYLIHGTVEKADYHRFKLDFSPEDESKRVLPNYTARAITEGKWESDTMTLQLTFTHHDADGASRSTSEGVVENGQVVWKENADEKPISLVLSRK